MTALAQLQLFDAPLHVATPVRSRAPAPTLAPAPSHESNTSAPASMRRRSQAWLALHFADLSLAAAYHAAPVEQRCRLDTAAWAVIDDDRLKHVIACNKHAWDIGIRPGHRMNAAIALCGSLMLVSRDLAVETRLLERLAQACLNYTSAVSVQAPHEILLEVRGSLRLFGGAQALIQRIEAELGKLNAGLRLALAPTARSAQWLARASSTPRVCLPRALSEALSELPIASLQWPLETELALTRFGVTTIGDLMRLSRKDLARRIGAGPVRELQQAMGRTPWLQRGWSTPPCYHDRIHFEFEIETTALLERMLERPLARLKRFLIGSARCIDALDLTLKHREGSTPLALRLQQPTADITHLAQLLHEHLDRLTLQAPVRDVWIDVPRLCVASPRNHALAMDPVTRNDLPDTGDRGARLLEQLQSRFGAKAIRALCVRADHVPERAHGAAIPAQGSSDAVLPAHLPRRPLWLLPEPRTVTREFSQGRFCIQSSPETIEAEGWDGPCVRRAYYRARTREGAECWLYRDLNPPHAWFVHGLFG